MSNPKERAALREIIKLVKKFDIKCSRDERTDTGDVWDLFDDITDLAKAALVTRKRRTA